MPAYDTLREKRDLDRLYEAAQNKLVWIHRPLLIHDRAEPGNKKRCPCCRSRLAKIAETRQHIDVLINPITGARKVLSAVQDRAAFERLAKRAVRVYMPRRVSHKQLAAMECSAPILGIFGGVRGGKSEFLKDTIGDEALIHGGKGVQVWWVAPTLEKTEIGLRKLVHGESVGKGHTKRFAPPLFPPEVVRYIPPSPKSDNKFIELIDGTRICFKYGSRKGGNLKGEPPVFVGMDEGCEIEKRENYQQALDRLLEADGRLLISTTPVAGHWLKEEVYDPGCHVNDYDGRTHAWTHITAYDNPWVSKQAIDNEIKKLNDPQRVRREIMGEWVGSGPLLWAHFDEAKHVVEFEGPARDWGLVDVTAEATKHFLLGATNSRYGGMDFDINPMSFAAITIACPPSFVSYYEDAYGRRVVDMTKTDPTKFIFIQWDELVERCPTVHALCDRLNERGFNGTAIACDPSGAQYTPYRMSHGVDVSSTHTKELTSKGFPAKACHISDNGNPKQPPVLDRCNVAHKLMREMVTDAEGKQWPRFMIHRRCKKTIDSLRTQESDEYGKPIKEPGTESDRLSGPTDAMTYGMWPVFRREYSQAPKISFA